MRETELFNPFPGLRPFAADEDYLFFGRGEHTDQLLCKLRNNRFLAVIGDSGSGKSSLVLAGLLPALYGGFMAGAGADWRIAVLRPGSEPMAQLAMALRDPEVLGVAAEGGDAALEIALTKAALRRSRQGLAQVAAEARLPATANLLVLVDQFEELFRFKRRRGSAVSDDALAFVNLLLYAAEQSRYPIHVALTLRSDFLGDCTQFPGLPEAINHGQYLVPRLSRQERELAIRGPIGVGGADISPLLVQQLLNDVGDDPDQLPILQHALMRTYDAWLAQRRDDEVICLEHYRAIGGMAAALRNHAEEIYGELSTDQQELTARIFKTLTEKGQDGRGTRRPTVLGELCAVVGASSDQVQQVIDRFRAPGRTFLRPSAEVELTDGTVIDLSHESLMRLWTRLAEWVDEEGRSVDSYSRLARTAGLYERGEAGLWRPPDLSLALDWKERQRPSAAWAERYRSGFERAMTFLEESRRAWDAELATQAAAQRRELRRARLLTAAIGAAFLLAAALGLNAWRQSLMMARHNRQVLSQRLALQSDHLADSQHEVALLLAIEAGRADSSDAAERVLRARLQHRGQTTALLTAHQDDVTIVAWSSDGERLLTASRDGTAAVWNARTGERQLQLTVHRGKVWDAAWSPDDSRLASAGLSGRVKIWDAATGKMLLQLTGHDAAVQHLAWSADGERLATASFDETARVWGLSTGGEPKILQHQTFVTWVAWSGDRLATAEESGTVRLWDAASGALVAEIGHLPHAAHQLVWDVAGRRLLMAGADGTAWIWDPASDHLLDLAGHRDRLSTVAWSPDGSQVLTTSRDGTARIWDAASRTSTRELALTREITAGTWNPAGTTVALASGDGVTSLWDVASGLRLATLSGHEAAILAIAWNQDGSLIATGSSDRTARIWDPEDGKESLIFFDRDLLWHAAWSPDGGQIATAGQAGARLWDALTGEPLLSLEGHDGAVLRVSWSRDGRILTAGRDGTARLWNASSGASEAVMRAREPSTLVAELSPDDRLILTAGFDPVVRLWETGREEPLFELAGHDSWVRQAAWSHDGERVASADVNGKVLIFNVAERQLERWLDGHTSAVRHLAWSPDDRLLATGGTDRIVRVWEVATGDQQQALDRHEDWILHVAWQPSGALLASASRDGHARIWDVARGVEVADLRGHTGIIREVLWSADGQRLLTLGDDGTARLWSTSGQAIAILGGHLGRLTHAAWDPGNHRILTTGYDGEVDVYFSALKDLLSAACDRSVRNLTAAEWALYIGGTETCRETCPGKGVEACR